MLETTERCWCLPRKLVLQSPLCPVRVGTGHGQQPFHHSADGPQALPVLSPLGWDRMAGREHSWVHILTRTPKSGFALLGVMGQQMLLSPRLGWCTGDAATLTPAPAGPTTKGLDEQPPFYSQTSQCWGWKPPQRHSWEWGKVRLRSPGKSHPTGNPLCSTPCYKRHPRGRTQTECIPLAEMAALGDQSPTGFRGMPEPSCKLKHHPASRWEGVPRHRPKHPSAAASPC